MLKETAKFRMNRVVKESGLSMRKWYNKVYLESPEWKALRLCRLRLDGHQCTKCKSSEKLQVHHLRYRYIFDVTEEDLTTLCSVWVSWTYMVSSHIPPCFSASSEMA